MKKKMIVVDIDGVLARFDELFDAFIQRMMPEIDKPRKEQVHLTDRYNLPTSMIDVVFEKFVNDSMFAYCKPYPDIHRVNYLKDPVIITVRPKEAAEDTYMWLARHDISFNKVIITKDKSKYAKDTAVIFEDRGEYILPFAEAGARCFLFDQPYNQDIKHKNIIRVSGWKDINTSEINSYVNKVSGIGTRANAVAKR
jgi:uncharacterized HAD superfamily protein